MEWLFFSAQQLRNLTSQPRLVKCRCGYSRKAGSCWAATLENTAGLQVGGAGHFSVLRCPTEPDPASRIHGNTVPTQRGVSLLLGTHGTTIGILGCVWFHNDVIGSTSRPIWTGSPMNGHLFFMSCYRSATDILQQFKYARGSNEEGEKERSGRKTWRKTRAMGHSKES